MIPAGSDRETGGMKMKKLAALSLALLMTGCLAACASEGDSAPPPAKDETTPPAAADEPVPAAGEMTLLSVNVGKADAHLLICGDAAYLIDTGTKDSFDHLEAVLRANGITRLDGVILTHTHDDHTGGLKKLLKSGIRIDHVYASAFYNKEEGKHPAVKALEKNGPEGMEVIWLSAGDTLPFGEGTLTVIGPLVQDPDKENNNSLVLLASAGGGTLLLTGDMEFPEEESLLKAGLIPHADVIKIGNHGENDATSAELIRAVSPVYAVISTNTPAEPDTPSPRVMRLLESRNVKVLQTQDTEDGVRITFRNGEIIPEE